VDLAGYLAVLRRRLAVIVLCVFAGIAGGLGLALSGDNVYQANARTLVNLPAAAQLQEALAGAQLSEHLVQTYAQIATSNAVSERAAGIAGVSTGQVRGALTAHVEAQTFLIDITARSDKPAKAQAIANAGAQALVAEVTELQNGRNDPISVQILDSAGLPGGPVSPRRGLDVLLGFLLGLVAGLLLASAIEALDKTLKSGGQAASAFRTRLLGTVPQYSSRRLVVVTNDGVSPAVEAYRALRTAVLFTDGAFSPRSILVTSPAAGDGKSSVAVNLAAAFALSGSSVALVDADLRDGVVARAFGVERAPGLSAVAQGIATTDAALQRWGDSLWVMPAGEPLGHPAELLGSDGLVRALEGLAGFDRVIVDVPAVLPVTDAVVLAAHVDAVILVARYGRTERSAAAEARRRLEAVGARVLGCVLNGVPRGEANRYASEDEMDEPARFPEAAVPVAIEPAPRVR